MHDSPWTSTTVSGSLTPVTTPIAPQSGLDQLNSSSYMTNSDKIALIQQWKAELATQASLDAQATTAGVSHTAYDNAVTALSSGLISAGAPSNWATIWPDGTTSGPWTNVQTSLTNLWANIATARSALQNAISAAQAVAAQSAAISQAATDATTKSNAVQLASQPHQVAWAYASKPTLPSSSYPAGYYAITSDNRTVQVNTAGTAWNDVLVATTGLFGQVVASQLTVMNFDNLIPNPNSEQSPPSGGWPSGALEIAALTTSDVTYSGTGCRRVVGNSGSWNAVPVSPLIPCAEGDQYYFEAMADDWGNPYHGCLMMEFFASSAVVGGFVVGGSLSYPMSADSSVGWHKLTLTGTAPAGSSYVRFSLVSKQPAGQNVNFDNLYARRMADASIIVDGTITTQKLNANAIQTSNYAVDQYGFPTAGARMDISSVALKVAPGNLQLGSSVFGDFLLPRIMQALDGSASTGRVLYRGNIDYTFRGGAANVACLTIKRKRWDTTNKTARFDLAIQPAQPSDNLDALRYASVQLFLQSAAGTVATMSTIDTFFLPLADRSYGSLTSESDASNASIFSLQISDALITSGYPAVLATLYNAYGRGDANCFYSGSGAGDGVALVNNGLSWPSGFTTAGGGTPSGGGTGTGGGSRGGGCPAPWVPITLLSGVTVHAGDLYDGAEVVGVDDATGAPARGVVRGPRRIWTKRMAIVLTDGRAPEYSLRHRKLTDSGWVAVEELRVGQEILGSRPGVVKSLGTAHLGEVIDFVVDGCHTYETDGLLDHNNKMLMA